MKFLSKAAFAAAAFFSVSSPAWADDQLFANSNRNNAVTLTLNGSTVLNATSTGWYNSDGTHNALNRNYIVGSYNAKTYNNFFVFDLSGITDTITSAVFSAARSNSLYGSDSILQYSLHKVVTPISTLTSSQSGATGIAIFNDLADGRLYGEQDFRPGDSTTPVAVSFTIPGLYFLNMARGSNFSFGGTINASAVPEPATWGMMLLGLGAVGAAMRYRRRSTKTTYA